MYQNIVYIDDEIDMHAFTHISWVDREGGGGSRGSGHPLKNHKNKGFLSNTRPDFLKDHKATRPALSVGPSSASPRIAI